MSERITLRHGSGGPAMRALVESLFARVQTDSADVIGLAALDDGAALRLGEHWLVVATDSHVVKPVFFPGGDIGRLAVAGTVNDLAMMGATEVLGLSCSIILEEGFERALLERIQDSIEATCREAGTAVLTGDTKVMGRGELDGVVLNTTGFGLADRPVRDCGLRAGDAIVVTGTIGDHGLAVMAERNDLGIEGDLRSDVAPLNELIAKVLAAVGSDIVAMKDPTRGGVASALHEMAQKSGVGVVVQERALPIRPPVRAVAELLGIDPLQVANEGKALIGVRARSTQTLLDVLRGLPLGVDARDIGVCTEDHVGSVILDTGFGRRLVPEIEGEILPRIC